MLSDSRLQFNYFILVVISLIPFPYISIGELEMRNKDDILYHHFITWCICSLLAKLFPLPNSIHLFKIKLSLQNNKKLSSVSVVQKEKNGEIHTT